MIESLAWVYSSQARKPLYGSLTGPPRLDERGPPPPAWYPPLAPRRVSKYALAVDWLRYARNRRGCRPAYVLFAAWYPAKALLKRIRDYGWYFVCRLQKNRRVNGRAVRADRRHPYWAATGQVTGGLKVLVVRYGAAYYATSRLTLAAAEVRRLDRFRAQIEEGIRVCNDQLS